MKNSYCFTSTYSKLFIVFDFHCWLFSFFQIVTMLTQCMKAGCSRLRTDLSHGYCDACLRVELKSNRSALRSRRREAEKHQPGPPETSNKMKPPSCCNDGCAGHGCAGHAMKGVGICKDCVYNLSRQNRGEIQRERGSDVHLVSRFSFPC
jgi:hypothetical protein